MRVVHVNTLAYGGAFHGSSRIHAGLLKSGVESRYVYLKGHTDDHDCYPFRGHGTQSIPQRAISRVNPYSLKRQVRRHTGMLVQYDLESKSFPIAPYNILSDPLVKTADVIHLHWVGRFIDWPTFFRDVDKPVVWTLRDMNPFLGFAHYSIDIERNAQIRGLDEHYRELKRKILTRHSPSMKLVPISSWLMSQSRESTVLGDFQHQVIHNTLSFSDIERLPKAQSRKSLGLPSNRKILFFPTDTILNPRKGFAELAQALELLEEPDVMLITAGEPKGVRFQKNILHCGKLSPDELNVAYSAADVIVAPSIQEAFGNVVIEGLGNGRPVIGFKMGAIQDLIQPGVNGEYSETFDAEGLKQAIQRGLENLEQYDPTEIVQDIVKKTNEQRIAEQYQLVYESF